MVDKADRASAAGALADLFFAPPTPLEAQSVNELRHKYRDWRQAAGTVPHADVLDLNHHAKTDELRAFSKLRRVKTVGARLDKSKAHASSPVRRGACGECDGHHRCLFGRRRRLSGGTPCLRPPSGSHAPPERPLPLLPASAHPSWRTRPKSVRRIWCPTPTAAQGVRPALVPVLRCR